MLQKLEVIKTLLGLMVQRAESHAQKDAMIKLIIAYVDHLQKEMEIKTREMVDMSFDPAISPTEVDDIPF